MRKRDLAILMLSAFAIFFSLQHEGDFSFKEVWFHLSDEYPIKYEADRLPPPIVTDLNGDGKKEVLVATHDAKIQVVSALAVDHSGSRVLSGSFDYTVRMYDFQGMNARLQSFRQLEPFEGHQIRGLSWSPTSDRFLCVTGSAQAKIYDRDGLTLGEFVKGDMYIRDLKNTKGHISGLSCGEWHPKDKDTTSSEDGSVRI